MMLRTHNWTMVCGRVLVLKVGDPLQLMSAQRLKMTTAMDTSITDFCQKNALGQPQDEGSSLFEQSLATKRGKQSHYCS